MFLKPKFLFLLPFVLLSMIVYPISGAHGEGFPGIGERVEYARALPHYNLGNKYLAKKWYEKAVESYLNAIDIYPYDADVYINLGMALRRQNDLSRAEWAFKRAIELNKDDWMSLSNLANILMIEDKFSESLKYFNMALKCKDLPKEDKKAILYNIDGIKKIMKNKGLLSSNKPKDPVKKKKISRTGKKGKHRASVRKKSQKKVSPAAQSKSYEQWLDQ